MIAGTAVVRPPTQDIGEFKDGDSRHHWDKELIAFQNCLVVSLFLEATIARGTRQEVHAPAIPQRASGD